ncbi:uncharacterized protein LOC134966492 isoform X3 [Pseudophryne corroboree]|uniref:uncharacterized protein LOC134966492 isoform X3 n=1 Tax=Pseudophryne corroboree TaxID=495146 RepID=UPI00308175CF
MASIKSGGTWADLQESLTRVRQQYGLLPRAGWDDLIAMTSYEKAVSAKHRNKTLPRPFLPSLQTKKVIQPNTDLQLHKQHEGRKSAKYDPLFHKTMLTKKGRENTMVSLTTTLPLKKYYGKGQTKEWKLEYGGTLESISLCLLDELLFEILRDLSAPLLRRMIRDFINDHLLRTVLRDFIDEILTSIIREELSLLVEELNLETEHDRLQEYLIQSLINQEVEDTVIVVLNTCDNQLTELHKKQIILTANKHIVDMFIVEHLLGTIGKHEMLMFGKDSSQCLLDGKMLEVLLREQMDIQQKQQTTSENYPVRLFHQNTISKVALEVILTELNMMLVEDMEDILEYERDVELG